MSEEESIQKSTPPDDTDKKVVTPSTLTPTIQENQKQAVYVASKEESTPTQPPLDNSNRTPIPTEPEKPNQSVPTDSSFKEKKGMEVHHHSHLHHKRRWTDYLFEFFMLFLAVVLGFLFENLREHYVEHQRAKEYAQSLYNDLKKDAEWINFLTDFKKWRSKKLDSLMTVTTPSAIQANVPEAYYYSCFLVIPNLPFRPSDITIQQLRNSGTLRYFNLPLINRITQYYNNCNSYTEVENEYRQLNPPYSLSSKIFDADLLASLFSKGWEPDLKNEVHWPDTKKEFRLLPSYQQTLNEYRLYVGKQKRGNDGMIMLLHELIEKPRKELIEELQKEYHVQ